MSGYYAQVSNISGSKSCVATSAYMSREKMKDEQMNHTFNYSAHEHDHTFSNVTLCKNAPEEWQDKEKLWNAVEKAEKGKNTRKAKQWILAVPQEMTQEQAEQAVKDFQEWMAEKGMCSQADIHEPDSKRSASQIEKNKHVHVLATQRLINERGEWEQIKEKKVYANCLNAEGKPDYNPDIPNDTAHRIPQLNPDGTQKVRVRPGKGEEKLWERVKIQSNPLDNRELIEESRAKWAEVCNKHLSAEQQIDHRSYDRQGIDKVAQIHEGVGYHQQDERAEYNRTVKEVNENMERMKSQAPETLEEIRGELNAVRESLEHDGDSQRTARTYSGATADYPGTETSIRYTESQSREFSERADQIRAGNEEVKRGQLHNDFNLDRMGRQIQYASEKAAEIGEYQRDTIQEQRGINEKANSLRDKLNSIRERIIQVRDSIRQRFSRAKQTEQPDNSTRPTSQNTQPVKEQNTMPGMSRFAQIQAEQKLAREKQSQNQDNAQEPQKDSVREKLERFTQKAKEGRTEPLQSEKQEQTKYIHQRRGRHR